MGRCELKFYLIAILSSCEINDAYLAFQLATVMPRIAKSIRADNPNNKNEILWLISFDSAPPSPRTKKLAPRVITSHRPICSTIFDECFKLGMVRTSLMDLKPRYRDICLLNIPARIMKLPVINQKVNIVRSPIVLTANPSRFHSLEASVDSTYA